MNPREQSLINLQGYAAFFAQNIWEDERYGLTKNQVILLARIYFPDYFKNNPQINLNDPQIFHDIILWCESGLLNVRGIKTNTPAPNIPLDLADKVKTLEEYKRNQKSLDEFRKKTYYSLRRQTLKLDNEQKNTSLLEQQTIQLLTTEVYQQVSATPLLTDDETEEFISLVVSNIRPSPENIQTQFDKQVFDNAVKISAEEWASQDPLRMSQAALLTQAINNSYQKRKTEIEGLYDQQKKYYPLLTPENDETAREKRLIAVADEITKEYKNRNIDISNQQALFLAEKQVDAECQISLYTDICTKTLSLIEASIQEVELTDPNSAKILRKKKAEIAYDVATKIATKGNLSILSDEELLSAIENIASTSAESSVWAHTDLPHGPSFRKAGRALKAAVVHQIPNSPVIQIAQQHQSYTSMSPDKDGLGLGIAYEGLLSFIISPASEKISTPIFEFFKGFGEATLDEYGQLPTLLKYEVYSGDPNAREKIFQSYGLNPEQKVAIEDLFKKFGDFSQKHKTIAGLINFLSKIELEKAQFSPAGIALTVGPAFFKGIIAQPDMAGQYAWYFAKQFTVYAVKQNVIRPRLNTIALKLGTHVKDPATHQIRFKLTYNIQKATVSFFKKTATRLGLKAPLWLTKYIIPGFGQFSLAVTFLRGPLGKLKNFLIYGLGAFYLWLMQFGQAAVLGSIAGGITGAVLGFIAGNIPGAILGFVLGTVGGGLLAVSIPKILGGIGSVLSGSTATASAAAFPGALTAGITSAALPITGVFLGTTIGVNLFYYQFLQAGFNPYRDTGQTSIVQTSKELDDILQKAADDVCIPVAMLKAISRIEAKDVWNYTPEEIAKFSTDGWWKTATPEELKRGYCVDTCLTYDCAKINRKTDTYCEPGDTNPDCRETTVYGPMQFEEITWASRFYCPKNPDGTFDNDCLMKRCNLKTTISAAAEKIKANSGSTKCDNWDKDTVTRAAKGYCGSCGVTPTCKVEPKDKNTEEWKKWKICRDKNYQCGDDYCGLAWEYYQGYK